jgi:hypothetical protein
MILLLLRSSVSGEELSGRRWGATHDGVLRGAFFVAIQSLLIGSHTCAQPPTDGGPLGRLKLSAFGFGVRQHRSSATAFDSARFLEEASKRFDGAVPAVLQHLVGTQSFSIYIDSLAANLDGQTSKHQTTSESENPTIILPAKLRFSSTEVTPPVVFNFALVFAFFRSLPLTYAELVRT